MLALFNGALLTDKGYQLGGLNQLNYHLTCKYTHASNNQTVKH